MLRIQSNETKSAQQGKKLLIQATPFSEDQFSPEDGCLSEQNIFRPHMPRLTQSYNIEITSEKKSNPTSTNIT